MSPIETGKLTFAHTEATAGVASGAAIAANEARRYLLIVNDSDAVVYLKVGAAAALNQGIRLNANGGSYEMTMGSDNIDTRVVNSITATGTKALLVTEGV